tara:strand:+ start:278 stop:718 length:441 start_codon:yes stop_codon:yes gene_type:complete
MAAGKFSFLIEQGSTVDFEIQYQDSDGTPVDLTGYQARMMIRPKIDSSTILMTLSSSLGPCNTGLNLAGAGGATANKPLASGSIGIYISHVSSSALNFDTYNKTAYYDLEIASGSGACATVTRVIEGTITLSNEVTKGSANTGYQY